MQHMRITQMMDKTKMVITKKYYIRSTFSKWKMSERKKTYLLEIALEEKVQRNHTKESR